MIRLSELQDDKYILIQSDTDLAEKLEHVALPKKYRADITGAIIWIEDGDIVQLWLCEDSRPYDLSAIYRPLPYYRPLRWAKKHCPSYWLEEAYTTR